MRSSVDTSSCFGVPTGIVVFVVGVFLSVSVFFTSVFGFLSSSGVATIGASSCGVIIAGASVGSVTSESTHRIRLQLVSVRERRARGKRRECFIK